MSAPIERLTSPDFYCVLENTMDLGESLLWDQHRKSWWWTDIDRCMLYQWSPQESAPSVFAMPSKLGSFVFCRSGRLLLGLEKQLGYFDPVTRGFQMIQCVEQDLPSTRINDGRTDRQGNYVFGTFDQADLKQAIGNFYQFSTLYGLRRLLLPQVAIANSICFSPDGRTMYFADTLQQEIKQCQYDAISASVSEIRTFAKTDDDAYPDGSVIDSEGNLWNAQWGAAKVVQYHADGRELRRLFVPAKNPTCPAFGGDALDQLCVSSARKEMSHEELRCMPFAGALFASRDSLARGLGDARFDDLAPRAT